MTDARVLALLTDARDQELIVDALDRFEIMVGDDVVPIEDAGYDAVIVDERRFRRHRETLTTQKEKSDPVYLPQMLLLSGTSIDNLGSEAWEAVDDIVDMPVRQQELDERLDTLLRARAYSEELHEQNERLDRFASVLSHDLRNPLHVAKANLDLVREGDKSAEDGLENVNDALDRIDRLVNDVLALARHGEASLDRERLAVGTVARDAWSNVETADATLSTADDLGSVSADEGQLTELFENLFRNAVEHGPSSDRADPEAPAVTVAPAASGFVVADDGAGIPPARREEIFEEGYSGSGGSGLGLSIVETIVDAHGWEIDVAESERGGARFEIHVD